MFNVYMLNIENGEIVVDLYDGETKTTRNPSGTFSYNVFNLIKTVKPDNLQEYLKHLRDDLDFIPYLENKDEDLNILTNSPFTKFKIMALIKRCHILEKYYKITKDNEKENIYGYITYIDCYTGEVQELFTGSLGKLRTSKLKMLEDFNYVTYEDSFLKRYTEKKEEVKKLTLAKK